MANHHNYPWWNKKISKHHKLYTRLIKLSLNIAILAGLVFLLWYGYCLFSEHEIEPLKGSIILIFSLAVWIALIKYVFRKYEYSKPSFKLTTFSILIVFIILTFAGVEPLSSYKDDIVGQYKSWQDKREIIRQKELEEIIKTMPPIITEATPKVNDNSKMPEVLSEVQENSTAKQIIDIYQAEKLAFNLINEYRKENGVSETMWDDDLYNISVEHTKEMANKRELFHSDGNIIGENCWGGYGYYKYNYDDLAVEIVAGWVNSPLHNAWLLHEPIKESCISIISNSDGQYASWTFWMNKLNGGPELVGKVSREYENSGSNLDWISWLKAEGYLY